MQYSRIAVPEERGRERFCSQSPPALWTVGFDFARELLLKKHIQLSTAGSALVIV